MKNLLLRILPSAFSQRLGYALLRASSAEFRAASELLVGPHLGNRDWRSGLGSSGPMLFSLVRALAPEVVLEIGSARGMSACCMAHALRMNGKGKVYAVDPHRTNAWTDPGTHGETLPFFRDRLKDYGLESWCEIIAKTSDEAARDWDRPIDFLYIDGDHTYDGVRQDYELFQRWLSPNALVAVHDTTWEYYKAHPGYREDIGVPRYMQELTDAGYPSITLPAVPGLTIFAARKEGFPFVPAH